MRAQLKIFSLIGLFCLSLQIATPDFVPGAEAATTSQTKAPSKTRKVLKRTLCALTFAAVTIPTAGITLGPYVWDYSLSSVGEAHLEKMDSLSRHIGSKLSEHPKTVSEMRKLWQSRLEGHEDVMNAFDADWGLVSYFYSKEDLALYALMIDPTISAEGPNTFGAYLYAAEEFELLQYIEADYENGFDYTFRGKSESELQEVFKQYLDKADGQTKPKPESPLTSFTASFVRFGSTEENEMIVRKHVGKLAHLASPLFRELIKREDHSVSQQELFDMALEIYGDPYTALGVITFMTSIDSYGDRSRAGLIAQKTEPIVPNSGDEVGQLYHFWGYAARTLYHGGSFRMNRVSWGYEKLYQGHREDRLADRLGMRMGHLILGEIARNQSE